MKKALLITTHGGFVPQFELNNVKILQTKGFEVHYASDFGNTIYEYDPSCFDRENIICHQIDIDKNPFHFGANRKAYKKIKDLMKKEGFDLIHVHNPVGGVLGRMAAAKALPSAFVIYTSHGFHFYKGAPFYYNMIYKAVERKMAKKTDIIITINREDKESALRFALKEGGRVELIPGVGIDTKKFHPEKDEGKKVRSELGIPQDAFHIITAAELNKNKNQNVVIEALSISDKRDIYYTMCGKGPAEDKLKAMIKAKGLEERVHITGFRQDMEMVLQSADCFEFPSKREGLGLAAIEALLCGVPVIAADNRGSREYMADGENGIICYNNTANEHKKAIEKLYDDRKLLADMSRNAGESAVRFSADNTAKKMEEIYSFAEERLKER